jgi:hypothetical protein
MEAIMTGLSLGDFHFKEEVDIGHFLTFITLVAGFIWWLYSASKTWREKSLDEARSGALRLLLKIIREAPNQRIELQPLYDEFQSDANAKLRRLYCRRRWKYKSFQHFEPAIYRLHYESKINFLSPTLIVFRTERRSYDSWKRFVPTDNDTTAIVAILISLMDDPSPYPSGLPEVAEAAMRLAPNECSKILHDHLAHGDEQVKRRAAMLIGRLVQEA